MSIFRQHSPANRPLHWLVAPFLILMLLLTGCAAAQMPATAQPTAASQPTLLAAMPTTAQLPTAASSLSSATFEGLSSGLDNATQARIRATNAVVGTRNVDVY